MFKCLLRNGALFSVILFLGLSLSAQNDRYFLTPNFATILVGDSQSFRMVDSDAHIQKNVSWSVFPDNATSSVDGDELVVTGKSPGQVTVTASVAGGTAQATVKILAGSSLPEGTIKWSVPALSGPETEISPVMKARIRAKRGTPGGLPLLPDDPPAEPQHSVTWNTRAASICDRLSIGVEQSAVRDALKAKGLPIPKDPPNRNLWLIEEPGVQCELSFNEKSVVTKKRKILVTD